MSTRRTLVLAREIARKSIVLRARSAFTTVTTVIALYGFFVVLVYGGQQIAPQTVAQSLSGIIVGLFVLFTATVAYATVSGELIREAQWGTLEQLFMSPLGFGRVVLCMTTVNVLVSAVSGVVLLALLVLTVGGRLVIDPVTVIPIGVLALGSAVGIGFTLGGLALVGKRIGTVSLIVPFAFIVCVAIPVGESLVLKLLPLALGSHLLRQSMAGGVPLWKLPLFDLWLLVVKSIVYVVGGYAVLRYAGRVARKRGRFGQY